MNDTDAFERAVRREEAIRRAQHSGRGAIRMASAAIAAFLMVWAVVVIAHQVWLGGPRWLQITHLVVYLLVVAYYSIVGTAVALLHRRLDRRLTDDA